MDYLKLPQEIIYRERRSLEEFADECHVNYIMIDIMLRSPFFSNPRHMERALKCFNTAYYICTLILHCLKRPDWYLGHFCEIACCYEKDDTICQSFTLSLVKIFLTKRKHENPDQYKYLLDDLNTFLDEHHIMKNVPLLNPSYSDIYKRFHYVTSRDFIIYEEFSPRIIDKEVVREVMQLKNFDWVRFSNYYEERTVRDIVASLGKTAEEKHNVIDMLRQAAYLFYSSDNNYVNTVNDLLDGLDRPYVDELNLSTSNVNHQEKFQEREKQVIIANYESRIQELEKENEELRLQNEQLQQNENMQRAIQEIKRLKEENTTLLVGFLKPAFYNDEGYTRNFLKEIAGKDNQGVTDVARKWLHDGKITPSKKGRFIWDILRVAKLYDATEQNWTKAMRKKD